MAPGFFLKTLGIPELRAPDGKLVRFRVRKHLALLVYLAVERRRTHDRGRLVQLFWPRSSAKQGRHSFATALSILRSVFGKSAFPASRPAVRFAPANLVVDVERLDAGVIFGEGGEPDLDVDGFLRGFDLDDAPEFGLWRDREHARRLPAIHAGLLTLIDHGRRRGSHDEIMSRAERLLTIDHLAEEGIRARMEAFALVGDRFSALRVFDEWREELKRELDAEPSMFLEGMAAQLRKRGWEPRAPSARPAVPAEQWRDRRFVGRKAEFRQLYEAWEAVHQYHPRHVLITGDSGVGKTTLAQRLVTAAGLEGASVSRVQCFQLEQRIPFAAIGGLVAGLLGRPGVAATSPEALAEIARIVPQVKDHFPNLPTPKLSEGESARLLFAEAVVDFLKAVMDERPLLLVMDDYHHADEVSLAVWHYVARRLTAGRMMAVLTVNPSVSPSASALARDLPVLPQTRIPLLPMSREECRNLLEAILEGALEQPDEVAKRALITASNGFPMALELVVRDWQRHRDACLALSFRAMTPEFRVVDDQSAGIYGFLVHRILGELSPLARQMLSMAAVLGDRSNELEWYCLVGLTKAQAADSMVELTERRILRDIGAGVEFINEVVRACVYRSLPRPIRILIHGIVAKGLVSDANRSRSASDLEVAWHLVRSGEISAARPYLLSGARLALVHGAPEQAILAIGSGFTLFGESDKASAGLLLAEAYCELGRWQDCLNTVRAHCLTACGEPISSAVPLQIEAKIALGLLDSVESRKVIHQLLELRAEVDADGVDPAAILIAARVCAKLRDYPSLEYLLDSIPPPPPTLSDRRLATLLTARAMALYNLRRLREAADVAHQALQLLLKLDARDRLAAQVHIGLGAIAAAEGNYAAAAKQAVAALVIAEHLDNLPLIRLSAGNASVCLCRIGHYHEAIAASGHPALRSLDPWSIGSFEHAVYGRCLSLVQLGKSTEAMTEWERAASSVDQTALPWVAQAYHLHYADLLWAVGRRKQALATAEKGIFGDFVRPLSRSIWGPFTRWGAKLQVPDGQASESCAAVFESRVEVDALDRLEILLAHLSTGRNEPLHTALLEERDWLLASLPAASIEQLRTVGSF